MFATSATISAGSVTTAAASATPDAALTC